MSNETREQKQVKYKHEGNQWRDCEDHEYSMAHVEHRRIILVPVEAKQEQVLYDCEHCGWSGTEVKTIHLEDRCPRCNSLDINTYSEAPKPKPQEQGEDEPRLFTMEQMLQAMGFAWSMGASGLTLAQAEANCKNYITNHFIK